MFETIDNTIRIGSTPTFLHFDLYLFSAYAGNYVYIYIFFFFSVKTGNRWPRRVSCPPRFRSTHVLLLPPSKKQQKQNSPLPSAAGRQARRHHRADGDRPSCVTRQSQADSGRARLRLSRHREAAVEEGRAGGELVERGRSAGVG